MQIVGAKACNLCIVSGDLLDEYIGRKKQLKKIKRKKVRLAYKLVLLENSLL